MTEQKSFILYVDNYQFLEELSTTDKSQWLDAVFLYKRDGIVPCFQKGTALSIAWRTTKAQLDRDAETWEVRRQRRIEAGRKGGQTRASNAKQSQAEPSNAKQSQANQAVNVNGNVNVNVNGNGNVNNKTPLNPPKGTSVRFIPPTVEQVAAYCLERQNGIDADEFVDFYESKGWMVGKNKMKSWKAAVRTWERKRDFKPSEPQIVDRAAEPLETDEEMTDKEWKELMENMTDEEYEAWCGGGSSE